MRFSPTLPKTLKGYDRATFAADLAAGMTVGVIALPLAIGFGIASGVTPAQGLWTAIIGGFLISAFGGSRVQVGGPTGAFVPILAGVVAVHGYGGLAVAGLMAGVILLTIAMLGAIESLLSAIVADGLIEERHDSNQELMGQGIANIVAPLRIEGPFFFGAAEKLEAAFARASAQPEVVIFRMRNVPAIDASGLHALEIALEKFVRKGVRLVLSGVQPQPMKVLFRSGFVERVGLENVCGDIDEALSRAEKLLEHGRRG